MFDPDAVNAAPPPPRGPNILSLLGGIWLRPGRTLRAVAAGPKWLWVLPLLLAVALVLARVFAAAPGLAEEQRARAQAQIEAQFQDMPQEMIDTLPEEATAVPEPSPVLTVGLPLMSGLGGILLGWLVRAALLHLGSLALGGRQSFGQIYRTSAWASFPLILRDAVQALAMVITGQVVKGSGLSGLLTSTGTASAAPGVTLPAIILGRIDLYSIWYVLLLVIAMGAAGKLTRGKAAAVVAFYAALSLLGGLGQLLTQGITGGF